MARAEVPVADITGLQELETRNRRRSFANVVRAVEDNLRGPREEQRAAFMRNTFAAISELPQGYVPIYLLARAYPQYIPLAIPMMRTVGGIPAEREESEKRIKKLKQFEFERTHTVEYTESDPVLTVDQDVARSVYNAIRYNTQQVPIPLIPTAALPNLAGTVSVSIEQKRDKWGLVIKLDASKEKEFSGNDPDTDDLAAYWESSSRIVDNYESPAFNILARQIKERDICRSSLGIIPMSLLPGGKDAQRKAVEQAFSSLPVAIPQIFDGEYAAVEDQPTRYSLVGQSGQTYTMQMVSNPIRDDRTIESIEIRHSDNDAMPSWSGDYQQFQRDLQDQMRVANGVLSWLYQYSRETPRDGIKGEIPNMGLLDWLLDKNLLEITHGSVNTFDDLGGHAALRAGLRSVTEQFIEAYHRELGAIKPDNIILTGESGIGKTAFENAMAAQLLEANVPVFILNGHALAEIASIDRQRREREGQYEEPKAEAGISNLKKLFYFLLINGGVLMIRDFDRILNNIDRPELNKMMELELLPELQRLRDEPSTWLIADTEFYDQLPGALINAHRLTTQYDIPLETDPVGIEDIIWIAVRKIDKEAHQRHQALKLSEIRKTYAFDITRVSAHIAKSGGILPAQIESIVRIEMASHRASGHTLDADSLTDSITDYVARREEMRARRELLQIQELQERLALAHAVGRDALALAQELADKVLELQRSFRAHGGDIDRFYRALEAPDGSLIPVEDLVERINRLERQVFPRRDPDSVN